MCCQSYCGVCWQHHRYHNWKSGRCRGVGRSIMYQKHSHCSLPHVNQCHSRFSGSCLLCIFGCPVSILQSEAKACRSSLQIAVYLPTFQDIINVSDNIPSLANNTLNPKNRVEVFRFCFWKMQDVHTMSNSEQVLWMLIWQNSRVSAHYHLVGVDISTLHVHVHWVAIF